ncbi:hypothetical protein HNW13_003465 [Shewanella sp. BF02_Schw]|uniref:hypothetical protein n=1 Tax=Shewanella sp. BF02_Schw TaxID=394908 RepID=UPI001786F6E0|nr:hypothetical protein [Shewanella sp. BF02_Schw]MBO1894849.1 hypothetical protein [Shewanella sp. BF02_Schw]
MDFTTTITTSAFVGAFVNVLGIFWLKERLRHSIKHEYDQDLEHLRKELEYDLDKKKRLYEGKLAQYKKYYAMMNAYSASSRKALFKTFQEGILDVITNPSDENTLRYIKSIFGLQGDISEQFLTFKNEIGGLRLEAGEELLSLLDRYIVLLEQAQDKTVEFLNWMNSNVTQFVAQPEETNAYVQKFIAEEFTESGKELIEVQEKMFKEMRRELGIV